MPWSPRCPPPTGLVRPVRVDPDGRAGPTRGQTQRGRWRRTTTGYYVPVGTDRGLVEQRILEESMRLGPAGAVTGWAALRLHGAAYFHGVDRPVPLLSPDRQLRPTDGSTASRERFAPEERVMRHGVPCATVERALFDEMRALGLWEAVVAMDMAAAAELTSRRRMQLYVGGHPGWPGVEALHEVLGLADDRSASPPETTTRLVWRRVAGLARPRCNEPVFTLDGRLLGVPDLLDPRSGTVVDYDGADHLGLVRRHRDLGRAESMRSHGLEILVVMEPDLREPDDLAARMVAARQRGLERMEREGHRWTLEPPPGWRPWRSGQSLDTRLLARDLRGEAW